MIPISEVLKVIQDQKKREHVQKLYEELEVLKVTYTESLAKLKQAEDQKASLLQEIEKNNQKIKEIEGTKETGKPITGLEKLQEELKDAKNFDDEEEASRISLLIDAENQKKLVLQSRNIELGKSSKESEKNVDYIKLSLLSYFNHRNTIKSQLTELGLDTKFNMDNIDSSPLKKSSVPPIQPVLTTNGNEQREKRKPSWEQDKDRVKQQKTDSCLITKDTNLHLIKDIDDKKFVKEWWTKQGYAVEVMSDKLEIKHPASHAEIVITDKSASTSSRDDTILRLMTLQLIDQLNQKGQLETANIKGSGPDAEKLDRLFKELKEKTLKQKNEFTMVNSTTNPTPVNNPRM